MVSCFFREAHSFVKTATGIYFHLHPEMTTLMTEGSNDVLSTILCGSCHISVAVNGKVPKYSIAGGVVFGDPRRIGLPQLTHAEQYVITKGRQLGLIVKLPGYSAEERQSGKKGHIFTFPHSGLTMLAEMKRTRIVEDSNTYPRVEGMEKMISVVFIGSKLVWDSLVPTVLRLNPQLNVRPQVVFKWLIALKHLHTGYRDIQIDNFEQMRATLEEMGEKIIAAATIIEEEMEVRMDKMSTDEARGPHSTDQCDLREQ